MKHITHDWEWIGFNALTAPLAFSNPLVIRLAVDIFAEHDWDQLHQLIAVMALTPQHHYQVITEQPGQMLEYMQALDLRQVIQSASALDLFMPSALTHSRSPWATSCSALLSGISRMLMNGFRCCYKPQRRGGCSWLRQERKQLTLLEFSTVNGIRIACEVLALAPIPLAG